MRVKNISVTVAVYFSSFFTVAVVAEGAAVSASPSTSSFPGAGDETAAARIDRERETRADPDLVVLVACSANVLSGPGAVALLLSLTSSSSLEKLD